jgi:L-galactose dehydrogenase
MSRLGLRKGGTMREAADLVRYALDLGITLIDTAKVYGTEPAVGAALQDRRDGVVVSTKVWPLTPDNRVDAAHITTQIEDSLCVLGLDAIDILHLHGVTPGDYLRIIDGCLPAMERARRDGKIRHIAISELWNQDLSHRMLPMALHDDHFDVVMVGCNMLNSSARQAVLPRAAERGVGTLLMFAVRKAFADSPLLKAICARLVSEGRIQAEQLDPEDPLGFLLGEDCASLTDAAYRYCRHLPGVNVVLTGTGDRGHLRQNIAAIEGPPLPDAALRRIDALFGHVDTVTGEA